MLLCSSCVIFMCTRVYHSQDDVADAFIVQLFDAVKSPRCYAVVALKTQSSTTLT